MPVTLEGSIGSPSKEQRQKSMLMNMRIPHRTSVEDRCVIQQISVAVRRAAKTLQEIGDLTDVITVQLGKLIDLLWSLQMMSERVQGRGQANLRIKPRTSVNAHLERRDACDVGHECYDLQVEHQLDVLLKRVRYAEGRIRQCARPATGIVVLDLLNMSLDLSNRIEIIVDPAAVGCA